MIRKGHPKLNVVKQSQFLGLHRSGIYFKVRGESAQNLELMKLMNVHYLHHPFEGAKPMDVWLSKDSGFQLNLKRVKRLDYNVMGLRATITGKHTSRRCKDHKIYHYLLRNMATTRLNQEWAKVITYIPR